MTRESLNKAQVLWLNFKAAALLLMHQEPQASSARETQSSLRYNLLQGKTTTAPYSEVSNQV